MRRLLPLMLSACLPYHYGELTPSTAPTEVLGEVELGEPVAARACQAYLFHFIPMNPRFTTQELVEMAKGEAVGLAQVTLEHRGFQWYFGYTRCQEVHGYRLEPVPVRARAGQAAPVAVAPSASSEMIAEMAYQALGLTPGTGDAWADDVAFVATLTASGMTAAQIVRAVTSGHEQDPEAGLREAFELGR